MSDEHGSADTRRSLTDLERAEIDGIWNDPDDDSPNASADSAGSAVDDDPDGSNGPGGPDSSDGSNGPDGPDEPGTGSEASDSTEGAIPIERRDFLKWGVAGAVADRSWFSSSVGDSGSDDTGDTAGHDATAHDDSGFDDGGPDDDADHDNYADHDDHDDGDHAGGPPAGGWKHIDGLDALRGRESTWFTLGPILTAMSLAVLLGVIPYEMGFLELIELIVDTRLPEEVMRP